MKPDMEINFSYFSEEIRKTVMKRLPLDEPDIAQFLKREFIFATILFATLEAQLKAAVKTAACAIDKDNFDIIVKETRMNLDVLTRVCNSFDYDKVRDENAERLNHVDFDHIKKTVEKLRKEGFY